MAIQKPIPPLANRNLPKATKTTKSNREDFSAETKRKIAFEAHLFCSNPACCRFTTYSLSSGRARAIAEAAHINAASPSGPRPSTQSKGNEGQLKSSANGIWLCKICHDRIDADPSAYPETLLKHWKSEHAKFVSQLVGKDFDLVHFELYARSRNTAQCFAFLGFIEGRRALFDALQVEQPEQVLESLMEVRSRAASARTHLNPDTLAFQKLRDIDKKIRAFLTAHPQLSTLKCDGADPCFQQFCHDLQALRADLFPDVISIAKNTFYKLNDEVLDEAKRLENFQ